MARRRSPMPPAGEHRFRRMVAELVPELMREHGYTPAEAEVHARRIAAAAGNRAHGKRAMQERAREVRAARLAAASSAAHKRARAALKGT